MKYLCEFKEFVNTELYESSLSRAKRKYMDAMRPHLRKYNVHGTLLDPYGIKALKDAKAAEASKIAAAKAERINNLQIQSKKPRYSLPQTLPNTKPQQQMMKPALNVQQKPFYRRFF
jgi:hypothetical protein